MNVAVVWFVTGCCGPDVTFVSGGVVSTDQLRTCRAHVTGGVDCLNAERVSARPNAVVRRRSAGGEAGVGIDSALEAGEIPVAFEGT